MKVGTLGPALPGAYAWASATISLRSLYTCVLEAPLGQTAHKWLQLAVFCSPLAPGQTHLQLRVYFLNNTPCALQWAITNEQPHGGRMRGPCQLFDFTGARADQCLKLKYISEGEGAPGVGVGVESFVGGPFGLPSCLPGNHFLDLVPSSPERTSWLSSHSCLPLGPRQPSWTRRMRGGRLEARGPRIGNYVLSFPACWGSS